MLQTELHPLAVQCQRRLDYIVKSGAKRGLKLPTIDEITQSLVIIIIIIADDEDLERS